MSKPTRIGINGAAGRMGKTVIRLLANEPQKYRLTVALERREFSHLGDDAGAHAGLERPLGVKLSHEWKQPCDVMIDFSTVPSTLKRAQEAAKRGAAMAIATTGFSDAQMKTLQSLGKKVPVLVAPNMSFGVNLIFALAAQMARQLHENYDIEIIEAHHNNKVDSPSGTALGIARSITDAVDWDLNKVACYGRKGQVGKRPQKQIGIHALRMGDVIGEHTVVFAGDGDRIELTHKASSRDIFAAGSLRAAAFLARKKHGFYSMRTLFGL